jgi:phage baseplate assembly protein gpV
MAKQIIRDDPTNNDSLLKQLSDGTWCDYRVIHLHQYTVKFSVQQVPCQTGTAHNRIQKVMS